MGSGIAQLAARSGFNTLLYDLNPAMLEKSKQSVKRGLQAMQDKGIVDPEQRTETEKRILYSASIGDCRADVLIEAIAENLEAKVQLFNQLMLINGMHAVYATNTSSLSVSAIAQSTSFPSRVAGMHFFNPAPLMKLVEIIRGTHTDPAIVQTLLSLAKSFGKTAITCRDAPGFIVNRVARPFYLEALKLVQGGQTSVDTIDRIMEANGFKMGPFRLMDLIGLDINDSVSRMVWEALDKPPRLHPSSLQQKKIAAGDLGRKTGKGFYTYG